MRLRCRRAQEVRCVLHGSSLCELEPGRGDHGRASVCEKPSLGAMVQAAIFVQ